MRSLGRPFTRLDLDAFDAFFCQAESFVIPHHIFDFVEALRAVTGASHFHIIDPALRALVDEFTKSFLACFDFDDWFEARLKANDYLFTVTRWDDRKKARRAKAEFLAQVARAKGGLEQLLSTVKKDYPEIDLVATSASARTAKEMFDKHNGLTQE